MFAIAQGRGLPGHEEKGGGISTEELCLIFSKTVRNPDFYFKLYFKSLIKFKWSA
jgi:hypothetical protein